MTKAEIKTLIEDREGGKDWMKRSDEVYALFKSKKLPTVIPYWHVNPEDIDLKKQPQKLREDLLADGYTIIENVDIETLLDCFDPVDANVYRDKKLYRSNFDKHRIAAVIDYWLTETKLIPPSILVRDSLVSRTCPDTDELMPSDGKHRLNVAYYCGAKTIPIFVINKQLKKVQKLLGISK